MLKSLMAEIFGVGPHPEETIGAADPHRRESRLVVIFSDTSGVMADAQLQSLMAHTADLTERDVSILRIDGDDVHRVFGATFTTPSPSDPPLQPDFASSLRREMAAAPGDFSLVLVGKDGHVKRRYSAPVVPDVLFAEIDSMPMRQAEMRR